MNHSLDPEGAQIEGVKKYAAMKNAKTFELKYIFLTAEQSSMYQEN